MKTRSEYVEQVSHYINLKICFVICNAAAEWLACAGKQIPSYPGSNIGFGVNISTVCDGDWVVLVAAITLVEKSKFEICCMSLVENLHEIQYGTVNS